MNDFTWTNHPHNSDLNTSYVSVQGTIVNRGPQTAYGVYLIVEIYVDYQCAHHMYALIKKEYLVYWYPRKGRRQRIPL